MKAKKEYVIFKESLFGVITILVLSIIILNRGNKVKADFQHVKGRLLYLEKSFEKLPIRNPDI
jgi:hypothetical protein